MNPKTIFGIAALFLLIASACAVYVPLDDKDLYCTRYGITSWCSEKGVESLDNLTTTELYEAGYINDYAFGDQFRYAGVLAIDDVKVTANLDNGWSQVDATYSLENKGPDNLTVHIVALEAPEGTELYLDSQQEDVDAQLDGIDVTFSPGERRVLRLIFIEPLYGDIFGYNINLLFDNRTVDNQITPTGTFTFILPQNTTIDVCAPEGYTTSSDNGRTVVTWNKKDFIPWTNPFNDLVCTWGETGTQAQPEAAEQPADNTFIYVVILIIILMAALVFYKRK